MLRRTSSFLSSSCRGMYAIFDMDGTLTPTPTKAGGFQTQISASPTFEPIKQFLHEGGNVVVETNAGTYPFNQVYKPLESTLVELYRANNNTDNGRFLIAPFSGAGMYVSTWDDDAKTIIMKEDTTFATTARSVVCDKRSRSYASHAESDSPCLTDPATSISEDLVEELVSMIRETMLKVFEMVDEDPTYLPLLSKKYRDALPKVVELRRKYKQKNKSMQQFNDEVLSLENLLKYGKFLDKSNDPMLDLQRVSSGALVQINILGTSMPRFDYIFPPSVRKELSKKYSIHIKRQPNSTTISKDQVNKGLPIEYLALKRPGDSYASDFRLRNSIAFGDHPHFTDYPMTQFEPMPFVSVSKIFAAEQREWPYRTRMIHLNDEEEGTAAYMKTLVDFCKEKNGSKGDHANDWWRPDYAVEVGEKCGVKPTTAK